MMRRLGVRIALTLTRISLGVYPSSFRREMGPQIIEDVRRRAGEFVGVLGSMKLAVWLTRLCTSFVLNAAGAWREHWTAGSGSPSSITTAPFSWLDVKLGLRMLVRHPGLTFVSVVALSIGIPASLIPIHGLNTMVVPLPFEEGDRIVGIRNWNVVERRSASRIIHDYFIWREELSTFEGIGALRNDTYNVISDGGQVAPVIAAEISASAFSILRVPPLLGRVLHESDEMADAADVVVISHELWRARMGSDPDVLGGMIELGGEPHEVVGVMPEGFVFPWQTHVWLPLRYVPTDFPRGQGPNVIVFGRLADGVSTSNAQAEIETIGGRLAREFPDTHERLRPQVMSFTEMAWGGSLNETEMYLSELFALALLMIVCGNVGTLILARTASRSGEIAVRTALGASRSRIVSQLFVESLVLAVASAGIGLLLADYIAARFQRALPLVVPFWLDFGVRPGTVVTAMTVAVLCAVVAGVLPALRATGSGVGASLKSVSAGSGIRFGRAATILIVAEVAFTVGLLAVGGTLTYALLQHGPGSSEIEAEEYLVVSLELPWTNYGEPERSVDRSNLREFRAPAVPEFRAHVTATVTALRDRLSAEPGVEGVAMGSRLPEMEHSTGRIEVEGEDPGEGFEGHRVRHATVDTEFFEGLGHQVAMGRTFTTGDLVVTSGGQRTAVIVNTSFVEHILGGRNPIGHRVRYVAPAGQEPGPWYEIVGVVGHLGMVAISSRDEGIYHPAGPGELYPVWMAIRLGADPLAFVPRLRRIASEVDPQAMIQSPEVMSDAPNLDKTINLYSYLLLVFLSGMTLLLSGAGLYALMSFTVSQRTREIGIRTALGARPGRVLITIARRTLLQLGMGIAAGVPLGAALLYSLSGANVPGPGPVLTITACSAFVFLVGTAACLGPTLRGLRIQPVEALSEG